MSAVDAGAVVREIVVGRNSQVWRTLAGDARIAARFAHALSHTEVGTFAFTPDDRVWVFSYSRLPAENERLLAILSAVRVAAVVYVSSASTIVTRVTRCYEYPRVKQLAAEAARRNPAARVLVLGLVHATPAELPGGTNAATSYAAIAGFLLAPSWPDEGGTARHLFAPLAGRFSGALESGLYRAYGALQRACGGWPCALRPLDYLLRALGWRWYGYIFLSNRLWYSTKS